MKTVYKAYHFQYEEQKSPWVDTVLVVCASIFMRNGKPTVGVIAEEFQPVVKTYIDNMVLEDACKGRVLGSTGKLSVADPMELFEYVEIANANNDKVKIDELDETVFEVDDVDYYLKSVNSGLLHDKVMGIPEFEDLVRLHGSDDPYDVELAMDLIGAIKGDVILNSIKKIGAEIVNS